MSGVFILLAIVCLGVLLRDGWRRTLKAEMKHLPKEPTERVVRGMKKVKDTKYRFRSPTPFKEIFKKDLSKREISSFVKYFSCYGCNRKFNYESFRKIRVFSREHIRYDFYCNHCKKNRVETRGAGHEKWYFDKRGVLYQQK